MGIKTNGEIILIEDNREILTEAFDQVITENKYDNRLIIIQDSSIVINYLKSTKTEPFLLLSEINMLKIAGFTLRDLISRDTELNERCVSYLFLTRFAPRII